MGGDGRCNIAGEVLVDGCRGVGGQQGDALLDGAARRRGRAQNRNWGRSVLDDDFGSGADVRHQPAKSRAASNSEMWIVAILKIIPPFGMDSTTFSYVLSN